MTDSKNIQSVLYFGKREIVFEIGKENLEKRKNKGRNLKEPFQYLDCFSIDEIDQMIAKTLLNKTDCDI